jgi:hypothetical protein
MAVTHGAPSPPDLGTSTLQPSPKRTVSGRPHRRPDGPDGEGRPQGSASRDGRPGQVRQLLERAGSGRGSRQASPRSLGPLAGH